MKRITKVSTLLLSLAILSLGFATLIFAEDTATVSTVDYSTQTPLKTNTIAGTTEGTSITWAYYDNTETEESGDCVLVMSGNTAIPDSSGANSVPWYSEDTSYRAKTTKIVVEHGITSIGEFAFNRFQAATEIVIADSVTALRSKSFCNCDSIQTLYIPESVTSIAAYSFSEWDSEATVFIPANAKFGGATVFNESEIDGVIFYTTEDSITTADKQVSAIARESFTFNSITFATANGSVTYGADLKNVATTYTIGISKTESSGLATYTLTGAPETTPAPTVSLSYKSGLGTNEFAAIDNSDATYDSAAGKISFTATNGSYRILELPKINSCALRLNKDINMVYVVSIPDCFESAYATVEFMGESFTLTDYETTSDGNAKFVFNKIMPQYMCESIDFSISAIYGGNEYSVDAQTTSVKDYCSYLLDNYSDDTELVTLVSDILVYGEKAQLYKGYNTQVLPTASLDLTPTVNYTPESKLEFGGTAQEGLAFSAAGLTCSDDMSVYFKFYAEDTEGLYFTISINGRTEKLEVSALDREDDGRYTVSFDGILAYEFDDAITVGFERGGETIGESAVFSVNSSRFTYEVGNRATVGCVCSYFQRCTVVNRTRSPELEGIA